MWDWIQENAWIVLWVMMTPFIILIALFYYITNAFDSIKISLKDWNDIDKDYFE